MSIIYEALKKVEIAQTRGEHAGLPQLEKIAKPKNKLYLIYIAVAVVGFVAAQMFFSLAKRPAKTLPAPQATAAKETQAPQETAAITTSQQPAVTVAPKPILATPPALLLNGVFFSGNEGYALINNQIVKEGDVVDGATVLQITLEEVELKFQDATLKLSSRK